MAEATRAQRMRARLAERRVTHLRRGRIYRPGEDLQRFGVTEEDLAAWKVKQDGKSR